MKILVDVSEVYYKLCHYRVEHGTATFDERIIGTGEIVPDNCINANNEVEE